METPPHLSSKRDFSLLDFHLPSMFVHLFQLQWSPVHRLLSPRPHFFFRIIKNQQFPRLLQFRVRWIRFWFRFRDMDIKVVAILHRTESGWNDVILQVELEKEGRSWDFEEEVTAVDIGVFNDFPLKGITTSMDSLVCSHVYVRDAGTFVLQCVRSCKECVIERCCKLNWWKEELSWTTACYRCHTTHGDFQFWIRHNYFEIKLFFILSFSKHALICWYIL